MVWECFILDALRRQSVLQEDFPDSTFGVLEGQRPLEVAALQGQVDAEGGLEIGHPGWSFVEERQVRDQPQLRVIKLQRKEGECRDRKERIAVLAQTQTRLATDCARQRGELAGAVEDPASETVYASERNQKLRGDSRVSLGS